MKYIPGAASKSRAALKSPIFCATNRSRRAAGFTLIEITVVLAIAAIATAITMGGFREMREGNKRTSCQVNLVQLYQAMRLYAADEGGAFPHYDAAQTTDYNGVGLWALYTFPEAQPYPRPDLPSGVLSNVPVERYIRSPRVLHCPSDVNRNGENHTGLYTDDTRTEYNPNYLSYQVMDDNGTPNNISDDVVPTYESTRTTNLSDPDWKRQLLHFNGSTFVKRPPADDTVVTWCQWHRNQRDFDNVLFYDGSVQLLPREQTVENDSGSPRTGWRRLPRNPS